MSILSSVSAWMGNGREDNSSKKGRQGRDDAADARFVSSRQVPCVLNVPGYGHVDLISSSVRTVSANQVLSGRPRLIGDRDSAQGQTNGPGTATIAGGLAAAGSYSGIGVFLTGSVPGTEAMPQSATFLLTYVDDASVSRTFTVVIRPRDWQFGCLVLPSAFIGGDSCYTAPRIVGHATTPTDLTVAASIISAGTQITAQLVGRGNALWDTVGRPTYESLEEALGR
jgi:hypothetical protein